MDRPRGVHRRRGRRGRIRGHFHLVAFRPPPNCASPLVGFGRGGPVGNGSILTHLDCGKFPLPMPNWRPSASSSFAYPKRSRLSFLCREGAARRCGAAHRCCQDEKGPIGEADILSGSSSASGSGPWSIRRPLGDDDAIYYKLRSLFVPAGASDQPLEDGRNRVRPIHQNSSQMAARVATMQIAALATNGRGCGATSENRDRIGAIDPVNELRGIDPKADPA